MKNFWNIAMVFAGTVIGAGFASGQELNQYFVKYGKSGVYGILLSVLLFTFLAAIVLCKISITGAENPSQYFGTNCPSIFKKSYSVLSCAFMFITFCTMITATGEMFEECLGFNKAIGIAIIYVLCVVAFKNGEKGTVYINRLLTPVIIIVTICIFLYTYLFDYVETFNASDLVYNPGTSSVVYVSYNTLGIIAIFTSVSNMVKNKTTAILAALTGGFVLLLTSLCIWYLLSNNNFADAKIPMIAALNKTVRWAYIPVLFCAMATTAVSCGFTVIKAFQINDNVIIALMLVVSYVISFVGFKRLVADVYAIFGYVGFGIGLYTIVDGIKYLKR